MVFIRVLQGTSFEIVALIVGVVALFLISIRRYKSNNVLSRILQIVLGLFGLGFLIIVLSSPLWGKPEPTSEPIPMLSKSTIHSIIVPANIYWVKTGILIDTGQHITMQVTGMVNTSGGTARANSDPNGNIKFDICLEDTCALKNFDYGALVGRIGGGNPFRIGVYTEIVAVSSGELELTVNDQEKYYYDNFGEFQVSLDVR